jgi:hypothetical protein
VMRSEGREELGMPGLHVRVGCSGEGVGAYSVFRLEEAVPAIEPAAMRTMLRNMTPDFWFQLV